MKEKARRISRACYQPSSGLLLLRVIAGFIFLSHGWDKFDAMDRTTAFMSSLHFPWIVAYGVATLEVVGGIALILGIATRLFGLLFGIEMLVAATVTTSPRGMSGHEFELLLAAVSFAVAAIGSGKYSLWRLECDRCSGMFCKGTSGCPGVRPKQD